MLILLSGLPAVGKTSLARALASRLAAVHLRIDTIEQALRSAAGFGDDVGAAGYAIAYGVADDNLRAGLTVIADAVNALSVTRQAWLAVAERAGARILTVEVSCSDATEHKRRATARVSDIRGLRQPTWREIVERRYEPWDPPALSIDTASHTLDMNVGLLLEHVSSLMH